MSVKKPLLKGLDDLGHAAAGSVVALVFVVLPLNVHAGFPVAASAPVAVFAATAAGYLREEWQMAKTGDETFGWSRARDVIGFAVGGALGGLGWPAVLSLLSFS